MMDKNIPDSTGAPEEEKAIPDTIP